MRRMFETQHRSFGGIPRFVSAVALGFAVAVGPRAAVAQDAGVAGDLERTASATPQEKVQYANDAVQEQRAALQQVEKLMEDAKRAGDTERTECLGERLSQIRALVQVTETAKGAMSEALDAGQRERADHEMRKIAVALGKTRQLVAESNGCLDDSGVATGDGTTVRVEGGLEGEGDETDPLSVDVLDQGFDPPQQSPFN
jgi:hypothetical protein